MIVVFGTVCLDRVRRLPRLPAPGEYVESDDLDWQLGGEAANTALSLAQWGVRPILVSNPLGTDLRGSDIRRRLDGKNLDLRESSFPHETMAPVCDVFVTPDGERTMIGTGFSHLDGLLGLDVLPIHPDGLFTGDSNFVRSSLDAARRTAAGGMRNYLMDFPESLAGEVRCEFWQASDPLATRGGADALARSTGAFVVLTRGAEGLVAGGLGTVAREYPAFPAPRVTDTTGAGDAFRAGMLYGLDRGWTLPACLQFAAATGSLSVGHEGASLGLPTLDEIAAHIAGNPQIALRYA